MSSLIFKLVFTSFIISLVSAEVTYEVFDKCEDGTYKIFEAEYLHNNLNEHVGIIQTLHGNRSYMTFVLYTSLMDNIYFATKEDTNACIQAIGKLQDQTDTTIVFVKLTAGNIIEKTSVASLISTCKEIRKRTDDSFLGQSRITVNVGIPSVCLETVPTLTGIDISIYASKFYEMFSQSRVLVQYLPAIAFIPNWSIGYAVKSSLPAPEVSIEMVVYNEDANENELESTTISDAESFLAAVNFIPTMITENHTRFVLFGCLKFSNTIKANGNFEENNNIMEAVLDGQDEYHAKVFCAGLGQKGSLVSNPNNNFLFQTLLSELRKSLSVYVVWNREDESELPEDMIGITEQFSKILS